MFVNRGLATIAIKKPLVTVKQLILILLQLVYRINQPGNTLADFGPVFGFDRGRKVLNSLGRQPFVMGRS